MLSRLNTLMLGGSGVYKEAIMTLAAFPNHGIEATIYEKGGCWRQRGSRPIGALGFQYDRRRGGVVSGEIAPRFGSNVGNRNKADANLDGGEPGHHERHLGHVRCWVSKPNMGKKITKVVDSLFGSDQ